MLCRFQCCCKIVSDRIQVTLLRTFWCFFCFQNMIVNYELSSSFVMSLSVISLGCISKWHGLYFSIDICGAIVLYYIHSKVSMHVIKIFRNTYNWKGSGWVGYIETRFNVLISCTGEHYLETIPYLNDYGEHETSRWLRLLAAAARARRIFAKVAVWDKATSLDSLISAQTPPDDCGDRLRRHIMQHLATRFWTFGQMEA